MLRDGDQVIDEASIIIEHVAGARLVPSLEARVKVIATARPYRDLFPLAVFDRLIQSQRRW